METEEQKKLTLSEALHTLREAWDRGVEYGQENNADRILLRTVVAGRVKALRTEKGFSQEQFSDRVNVPFLTYKGYENRRSDIPLHTLVRIANELGTTLDYLTGRTDTKEVSTIEDRLKRLEEAMRKKPE